MLKQRILEVILTVKPIRKSPLRKVRVFVFNCSYPQLLKGEQLKISKFKSPLYGI